MHRTIATFFVFLLLPEALFAQRPLPYPVTPTLEFQRALRRGTRTTTGEPGLHYWQQWTDYTLAATLDPEAKRVTGRATIVYYNRSPDVLPAVFVQLDQNFNAPGAVRLREARLNRAHWRRGPMATFHCGMCRPSDDRMVCWWS